MDDEVLETGVSPIFRMLDNMLRSDSLYLKELSLSAIFNAICGSSVLGNLMISQLKILETIFELFDEQKTFSVILKTASHVIQECARQGHFSKDDIHKACQVVLVAKKLIGSVKEDELPIEGIRII